jgi:hypothetical protein
LKTKTKKFILNTKNNVLHRWHMGRI